MKIELHHIKVKDLYEGYKDSGELEGVVAYGGKLDVRPPFQRLFVYDDKKRNAVIETLVQPFFFIVSRCAGTPCISLTFNGTISCQIISFFHSTSAKSRGRPSVNVIIAHFTYIV